MPQGDKKVFEDEHAMTSAIMRDMTDGVMIIDDKGIIKYVNPAGTQMLEYTEEYFMGKLYSEFIVFNDENDEFHEFVINAIHNKDKIHRGLVTYKTLSSEKILNLTTSFVFDEQHTRKVGISIIFSDVTQAQRLSKIRGIFQKYVDPQLVEKLIEDNNADSEAAGQKRHIAALFVDVRGFTPMSERLRDTPELVVEILNEYLELASNAVFNNGGSVDKFIGDATMALFNGFMPLHDYVFKAVKAGCNIVEKAAKINKRVFDKYGVKVGVGVGINCGEAIVGNVGTSYRKDYTAIGDMINTAARLEAKAESGQVLISRDVVDALADRLTVEEVGSIFLKGKSIKTEVYSVLSLK